MMTTEHRKRIAEIEARLANGPIAPWSSRERAEFETHSPADIRYLLDGLVHAEAKIIQQDQQIQDWRHDLKRAMLLCTDEQTNRYIQSALDGYEEPEYEPRT